MEVQLKTNVLARFAAPFRSRIGSRKREWENLAGARWSVARK